MKLFPILSTNSQPNPTVQLPRVIRWRAFVSTHRFFPSPCFGPSHSSSTNIPLPPVCTRPFPFTQTAPLALCSPRKRAARWPPTLAIIPATTTNGLAPSCSFHCSFFFQVNNFRVNISGAGSNAVTLAASSASTCHRGSKLRGRQACPSSMQYVLRVLLQIFRMLLCEPEYSTCPMLQQAFLMFR